MRSRLKQVSDQVMVITGASSGINLVAARMAAERGARVVLVSRNEDALREICDGIRAGGGDAAYAVADVADEAALRAAADLAIERHGRIDTWVNGAAVSAYARLSELSIEDHRRLFETNYWGVVNGTRVALAHLERSRGSLINIGSVLGDRSIPIQGAYSASKHAVKAFTVALRMELDQADVPVSVTLIKPSAIDTPYMTHAKNYLAVAPKNPPPIYAPHLVARAILYAAENHVRDIVVGGGGRVMATLGSLFPQTSDRIMSHIMPWLQQRDEPAGPRDRNNLYAPSDDGHERSGYRDTHSFERSLYTAARLNPLATFGVLLALGAVAAALMPAPRARLRDRF